MERNNRKSIATDLSEFCIMAKKGDFIEVCEWSNGEGYDITINTAVHSFTNGQLKAIDELIKHLEYGT